MDDVKQLNLYALLGISPKAENPEIKKAFRKKALGCHPDKNPDDPDAVRLFLQLSKALEVLLDEAARAAYDRLWKAKEANKARNQALDAQRKKFKDDLEQKEMLFAEEARAKKSAEEKLQQEIERLRKRASKEVEEEAERVRKLLKEQLNERQMSLRRVQIRWNADKNDSTNGGYNEKNLTSIFSKYGNIDALVISSKKKGSALLEFSSADAARKAEWLEIGYTANPLKVKVLGSESRSRPAYVQQPESQASQSSNVFSCFSSTEPEPTSHQTLSNLDDFETMVLKRMREAQAKKNSAEASE